MSECHIHNQTGSVLLYALIMLLVISLVGVSSVRVSQGDDIMANNFEDKAFALEIAERSILEVEQWIVNNNISGFDLAVSDCALPNCFNLQCHNGMCATAFINEEGQCVQSQTQPWSDANIESQYPLTQAGKIINVWDDSKRHQLVENKFAGEYEHSKYIIEFLCFSANSEELTEHSSFKDQHSWSEIFRITVLASGKQSSTHVMLQTVFKQGRI